ncbi:MAG: ADP-ribosylglycohydrolase family protein [Chloroflexota bacterium]
MTELEAGDTRPVADRELLERAQGVLLGQLTGDALGSQVEFVRGDDLRRRYPNGLREIGPSPVWNTMAGQPTDESEMALALTHTLLRDGNFAQESVLGAYVAWLDSGPFDIGRTIRAGLHPALQAVPHERLAVVKGKANKESQANGALMRQSPLAIWGYCLPAVELDMMVRADTILTHPHRICQDASAAFVVALAAAIRGGLNAKKTHNVALEWSADHGSSPEVTKVLEAACDSRPDYERLAGWVLVALQNAFFQALHAKSFEEGLVDTVMGGGDTDTNAAIAGALLGGICGVGAIPPQWSEAVLTCRPELGAPGVHQPRPKAFWSIDALNLAEQLVRGEPR